MREELFSISETRKIASGKWRPRRNSIEFEISFMHEQTEYLNKKRNEFIAAPPGVVDEVVVVVVVVVVVAAAAAAAAAAGIVGSTSSIRSGRQRKISSENMQKEGYNKKKQDGKKVSKHTHSLSLTFLVFFIHSTFTRFHVFLSLLISITIFLLHSYKYVILS